MQTKSRRLALRFGLGSLFLALTVASLLLAWGTSIVHERRDAIREFREEAGVEFTPAVVYLKTYESIPDFPAEYLPDHSIPWWRSLLGDEGIAIVMFPVDRAPTDAEQKRLERIFPEAHVFQQQHRP